MGNITCLFHGLWRAGKPKDEFRESRSATVDTNSSADSGFQEPDSEIPENGLLGNVISALRYFYASIINLTKADNSMQFNTIDIWNEMFVIYSNTISHLQ